MDEGFRSKLIIPVPVYDLAENDAATGKMDIVILSSRLEILSWVDAGVRGDRGRVTPIDPSAIPNIR